MTATVCSKWAESEPSAVTTVHPSPRTRVASSPRFSIGSTATTSPGRSSGPRPGGPQFWMNGSSCIERPIPWPPYSRTTPSPSRTATVSIALPMSDRRPPGCTIAIAASRAASVVLTRRSASPFGAMPPTKTVTAESEWNPSQIAPKSSESTSASSRTRFFDGIPWTISALIEAQIVAGKPR